MRKWRHRGLRSVVALAVAALGLAVATAAEQPNGTLKAQPGVVGCDRGTDETQNARPVRNGCPIPRPGDAEAVLAWLMSLPQGSGTLDTGPGGATIPGTVGLAPPPVIAAAPAAAPAAGEARPNEVLVALQPGATVDVARSLARDHALLLEVFAPSRTLRMAIVRFRITDARPLATVLATLSRDPRVRAIQPNYLYHLTANVGVPASGITQYSLSLIHAREALALVPQGAHVPSVAVIDTGIDEQHPDLAGVVRDRFDAVGDGHWDVSAHGTGIAGIIAARGQLQGVDPQAVVLSVRAFPAAEGDAPAEATSLALLRGVDWAVDQTADVINMSLAGPPDPMVDAAVEEAMKAGVIVVAAAGNNGPGAPPAYPAAVKGVAAVTAIDARGALFKDANHGAYISVAAPGVDVLSDIPGGGVALATGTSQAAAHVSGVMAMLRALKPGVTPAAALEVVSRTASPLGAGGNGGFGAGRLDAAAALERMGR